MQTSVCTLQYSAGMYDDIVHTSAVQYGTSIYCVHHLVVVRMQTLPTKLKCYLK